MICLHFAKMITMFFYMLIEKLNLVLIETLEFNVEDKFKIDQSFQKL